MIERLPRFAETELQRLCAKAGALCHAVDEDESGWDRLIEFPEQPFLGPVDRRPPRMVAYAQVKSVEKGPLRCRIKLSNALRAASSPQPWFIVLVTGETPEKPSRVFAIHVWNDLISQTLEAGRRAHNEKHPLNRRSVTIKFGPEDEKGESLVQWMQAAIAAAGKPYEAAKRAINETAGYESGYGVARLVIEASSQEEVLKSFLGLGNGINVSKFTLTSSRFGIASPLPEVDLSSGIAHFSPKPTREIEIRLRSQSNSRLLVLFGHAYGASLSGKFDDKARLRFSASFLELLWRPDGECHFNARINGGDRHDLETIENYVTLRHWLDTGPVDLQVWSSGKRVIGSKMNPPRSEVRDDWPGLASALRLLQLISGQSKSFVSLNDLFSAASLRKLSRIAEAETLRLEFEPSADAPTNSFDAILYWFKINIGNTWFYAMFEWKVIEDSYIETGKRSVRAEQGQIVEAYALCNPSEEERRMIERDYQRRLDESEEGMNILDLGDLCAFIAASSGLQTTIPPK